MLAGTVKIDDLKGAGKMLVSNPPNPGGAISQPTPSANS